MFYIFFGCNLIFSHFFLLTLFFSVFAAKFTFTYATIRLFQSNQLVFPLFLSFALFHRYYCNGTKKNNQSTHTFILIYSHGIEHFKRNLIQFIMRLIRNLSILSIRKWIIRWWCYYINITITLCSMIGF